MLYLSTTFEKKVKFKMPLSHYSQPGGYLVGYLGLGKNRNAHSQELIHRRKITDIFFFTLCLFGSFFTVWFLWKSLQGLILFST